MSLDPEESIVKSKGLKQLTILDIFRKQSKKRRLNCDDSSSAGASPRKRPSVNEKPDSLPKMNENGNLVSKKIHQSAFTDDEETTVQVQGNNKLVYTANNEMDSDSKLDNKDSESAVKEASLLRSKGTVYHMNNLHSSIDGDGETKSDIGMEVVRKSEQKTLEDIREKESPQYGEKVFQKQFASHQCGNLPTEKLRTHRVTPLSNSESPRNSQDSDDLYDIIMQQKSEANRRLLKMEIKEDSDISQGTPPHPSSPKTAQREAEKSDDVMNIYSSQDMFETFPSQDFMESEEENVAISWLGKPKSRLRLAPDCLLPLPKLERSRHHTILIDTSFFDIGPPPPSLAEYADAWDWNHVKLPCSPKSMYPVDGGKSLANRWEMIQTALYRDITNSEQLEAAILHYNSRYPRTFRALHSFFKSTFDPAETEKFFSSTLPKMVDLALSLPNLITQPIPLLRKQNAYCLTLSQQQIACLLANAFFCTFPRRNSIGSNSEYATYPSINFNRLFIGTKEKSSREQSLMEKLKTIIHYFTRVTEEVPSGLVTFERRVQQDFPVWNRSPCTLGELHIRKNGLIEEEGRGMLQMDFANKYIGGGVLGYGMVQEEIMFCICPELIVSRLFTEVLDDNECLLISGVERFSAYSGYAETYKWEGDYIDPNTRDSWRRKATYIVALDATPFSNGAQQYRPGNVRRELNKLYCGFRCDEDPDYSPAIATGNWGCGAFGGDPILKALLQLMAAAVVGRELCYFTFNDDQLMNTIHDMYAFVETSNIQVGELWNMISRYNEEEAAVSVKQKRSIAENIFEFMQRLHKDYQTSTDDGSSSPEKMSEEF